MINRITNNKLYLISIAVIIFVFLSSAIIGGCKIQVEAEDNEEGTAQIEEVSEEESAQAEEKIISEVNDISVEEVYQIISSNQDYIILDVRTPDEFKEGHIEGAILIPVSELEDRLDKIPKDKHIIVYCDGVGCSRSGKTAVILVDNGFEEVYDMTGEGIIEWQSKGYPVIEKE